MSLILWSQCMSGLSASESKDQKQNLQQQFGAQCGTHGNQTPHASCITTYSMVGCGEQPAASGPPSTLCPTADSMTRS